MPCLWLHTFKAVKDPILDILRQIFAAVLALFCWDYLNMQCFHTPKSNKTELSSQSHHKQAPLSHVYLPGELEKQTLATPQPNPKCQTITEQLQTTSLSAHPGFKRLQQHQIKQKRENKEPESIWVVTMGDSKIKHVKLEEPNRNKHKNTPADVKKNKTSHKQIPLSRRDLLRKRFTPNSRYTFAFS